MSLAAVIEVSVSVSSARRTVATLRTNAPQGLLHSSVASMDDLFAHKLKVIHDRAEAKDYQDIAVMLASGQNLSRGLAALETLFGSSVPPMVTLKSLAYFNDLNEPWRLTDDMKATITRAIGSLPNTWEKIAVFSHTLYCPQSKKILP
jgi:hypothetical protein